MQANPVGGYFNLEIHPSNDTPLLPDGILLNSGRACFEYILEANDARHVFLPKFTCDVMLGPLEKLGIPHTFYSINDDLELVEDIRLSDGDFLVYTNYFGLKGAYCDELSSKYREKLILDCSQALYYVPPELSHTFYSPRKFFGMPDGGILYTDKKLERQLDIDVSFGRMSHLLKRLEKGPGAGYSDFKANDRALRDQPLREMSILSKQLFQGAHHVDARKKRNNNFQILHNALGASNNFAYRESPDGAMGYVYRTKKVGLRDALIGEDVFVPTYWPNVYEWSDEGELEYTLTLELLVLPIDQRYGEEDMKRIIKAIDEHHN